MSWGGVIEHRRPSGPTGWVSCRQTPPFNSPALKFEGAPIRLPKIPIAYTATENLGLPHGYRKFRERGTIAQPPMGDVQEKGVITLPQIEEKPTAGRPTLVYVVSGEQGKRDNDASMPKNPTRIRLTKIACAV